LSTFRQDDSFHLARKSQALQLRAKFTECLRRFFIQQDFLEVETPLRVPSPAPEEHIEAIPSGNWFLQTSPEICMKRLLAAGYPRIFQFCKCFRADERGNRHLPEFSMLEWYVLHCDYRQLMDQCEALLQFAFREMGHAGKIVWRNKAISLSLPWEKITVADAFSRFAPVRLTDALTAGRFDEVLVEYIEPNLGNRHPVFLCDYPAQMASLAKVKKDDPAVAERFELYIGGMEIANGFSELTDAREQRQRFEEALKAQSTGHRARYAMPEPFLAALESLPPCAGIALGMDRMIMILADTATIDDVIAFPPESL
jgi:lysyl-tRNA synthetase class 2